MFAPSMEGVGNRVCRAKYFISLQCLILRYADLRAVRARSDHPGSTNLKRVLGRYGVSRESISLLSTSELDSSSC